MLAPIDATVTESENKQFTGNYIDITWSDQKKTRHSSYNLRMRCPCANCKGKTPQGVLTNIRITAVEWVGRYAVHFIFSDGHNIGIYTYNFLRDLTEEA